MATADEIRRLLRTEGAAVEANTRTFNEGRYRSVADLEDYEALKAEARAIKEDAIERLPELLDQLTEVVEAHGGTVHLADDAEEATEYVRAVVADRGADRVVKSKSMTSEEIEVNDALAADGVDVVETDLGEWVVQLADESPSHIVAPAIHRSRGAIAELFEARFDLEEPLETAEELTAFARETLGDLIVDADVGLTGANFLAADTGTMALVTSEGNARKSIAATDVHVAVAGVEKVVPTVGDLEPFLELLARSATGQALTSYVSLLTPPVETPVVDFDDDETPLSASDADREFHLVLVDNGRLAMREDEDLRETLYCIRCGACANACANFQQVGGHAFGGETYAGGIATGWEAGVEGLDVAAEFNDLCTGCSRCVNACPVKIDVPWINAVVRDRVNRGSDRPAGSGAAPEWLVDGLTPDEEPGGVPIQKRLFGNVDTIARLASATAPVSNWLASARVSRWLAARFLGVDPRRDLPTFERETLVEWSSARESSVGDPVRRAVLYPDVYTNYADVDRGRAAVAVLEALGVDVVVPAAPESGRAPLSQGMIATARERAERVAAALDPYVRDGRDVVVIEPSDHAMFQREYARLLDEEAFATLAENSYEALEYVYGLLEDGADASALATAGGPGATERGDDADEAGPVKAFDGPEVAYHAHCQQRTLGLAAHTVSVLERCGYDVVTTDVECCGMAGSFGYKADYYDLSVAVGEALRDQLEAEAPDRPVVASGTSCTEQLDALLDRGARHPVELLAPPE